ncbi:MAG: protein kinase, partial [Anaerolineae bacterium]|nr:protein kinase [Anaerolineae bacterium]
MTTDALIGQQLGQYKIDEMLGAGGMGSVYRATQSALNRTVAVKVMLPQMAQEVGFLERFNREAQTAAKLEHPHIVPVYDYGQQGMYTYIVMRYLTGGSLQERINRLITENRPLPSLEEADELLKQLAGAMDYAHSLGVIHRDIKLGNVMFDHQGRAYVVDFGIAKLMSETTSLTHTGASIGTPSFMPPEQWRGDPVSPASDQYALAVMMYAVLTGQMPFKADTPFALMHKHLNEMPTDINTIRAVVPSSISGVINRALAKEAKDRYDNCMAFSSAFHDAIQGIAGGAVTNFFTFSLPKAPTPTPSIIPKTPYAGGNPPTPYGNTPYPTPQPYGTPQPSYPTPQPYGTPYPPTYAQPKKKNNALLWIIGVVVLAIIGIGAFIALSGNNNQNADISATATTSSGVVLIVSDTPDVTATSTNTATATVTNTATTTFTPTLSSTERAATLNAQAQSTLDEISTLTAEAEAVQLALAQRIESTTLARIATETALAPTATNTSTPTDTPTSTATATNTPRPTATPTDTSTPTATNTATNTPRPSATPTNTIDARATEIAQQFFATQTAFASTQQALSLPSTSTPVGYATSIWANPTATRTAFVCSGTASSYFAVGDRARLTPLGDRNRIRQSASLSATI